MHQFSVLLDSPAQSSRQIQIARLGKVSDSRYGDFEITADNVTNWKRNLSHLPGQRALIDFEHRSEKSPRNSEAAGWITGINLDGEKVMADAEWTDKGEEAIRNKRYLFLSPAYGTYRDEHGKAYEDTLCSTALTNKPVLGSLPMLTLASEERVSEALEDDAATRFYLRALDGELGEHTAALVALDVSQAERDRAKGNGNSLPDGSYPINNAKQLHSAAVLAASHHGDWKAAQSLIKRRAKELGVDVTTLPGFGKTTMSQSADSRAHDMDTAALIKLLDLDPETDEDKILEAVTALKDKPADEPKTLEQLAADEGKTVLDTAQWETTKKGAEAGALAMAQLHQQRFDHAFEASVKERKVTPAEHEDFDKLYRLDSELALKMLSERAPVLPEKPLGGPSIEFDPAEERHDPQQLAQAGIHPENHELHRAIEKHMLENKLPKKDYAKVLDQYMRGAIEL